MPKKDPLDGLATKQDIQNAVDELAIVTDKAIRRVESRLDQRMDGLDIRMNGLDKRMDGLDKRMDRLESGQSTILDIVKGIDEQLREYKGLPERVARLERTVFRG